MGACAGAYLQLLLARACAEIGFAIFRVFFACTVYARASRNMEVPRKLHVNETVLFGRSEQNHLASENEEGEVELRGTKTTEP